MGDPAGGGAPRPRAPPGACSPAWAGEIAKLAPLSMAAHKLGLNVVEDLEPSATYQAAYRDVWASADLAEGLAAFSEKRSPRFRGA